jgi:hypothetical protein
MRYFKYTLFLLIILISFSGCFSIKYDFKGGAQVDPKIKTLSVQYLTNRALIVNPSLSQSLTDKLKAYMESNTSLKVVNSGGDVDFSGEIVEYSIKTTGITSGNMESQTRFTISVRIKYTNFVNPDDNFDTNFSRYRDFSSDIIFKDIEDEKTEEIVNEIIEQIFNKAFVNW